MNGLLQIGSEIRDLHQNINQLQHFVRSKMFSVRESGCLFTFWSKLLMSLWTGPLSNTDQICQLCR